MPSSVYQCKNAFLLNISLNYSHSLLNNYCMAVKLPIKVADLLLLLLLLLLLRVISKIYALTLLGIHYTKYDEFLPWIMYGHYI